MLGHTCFQLRETAATVWKNLEFFRSFTNEKYPISLKVDHSFSSQLSN